MFGDSASSRSGGAPSLYFPTFLLPSLRLPFWRTQTASSPARNGSPDYTTNSPSPAQHQQQQQQQHTASVPSLSNSPASTASDPATSPTSCSFFPDFEEEPVLAAADGSKPRAIRTPARNPHLARVHPDTLRCNTCSADIAFGAQIVSKGFTGRHGRAYLVSPPSALSSASCPGSPAPAASPVAAHAALQNREDLVNVRVGRSENRQLVTGAHVVADISCLVCGTKLGWKYVDAREATQKYKVGKFILETQRVVAYRSWEDVGPAGGPAREAETEAPAGLEGRKSSGARSRWSENLTLSDAEGGGDDDAVVFDSDDEDECEDIFAGTWDAETVAQRRRSRVLALARK